MTETVDDRVFLTYDEAVAMLPDWNMIHTFTAVGMTLFGADWSREHILVGLRDGKPELTGEKATAIGYRLAFIHEGECVFVETRKEEKL